LGDRRGPCARYSGQVAVPDRATNSVVARYTAAEIDATNV
jgi:hypothetical protein